MKKVLVVVNKLLLGAGLESLLSRDTDLSVKCIFLESKKLLEEEIKRYQPNVVIIEKSGGVANSYQICNLLAGNSRIRFLIVDSIENNVSVYDSREIIISQSCDLIEAVKT